MRKIESLLLNACPARTRKTKTVAAVSAKKTRHPHKNRKKGPRGNFFLAPVPLRGKKRRIPPTRRRQIAPESAPRQKQSTNSKAWVRTMPARRSLGGGGSIRSDCPSLR